MEETLVFIVRLWSAVAQVRRTHAAGFVDPAMSLVDDRKDEAVKMERRDALNNVECDMQTYPPLSAPLRLAALGAAVLASAIVMVAAMLPFGLDSPERGDAILAREAAVQSMRVGAASAPAGRTAIAIDRLQDGQVRAAQDVARVSLD